MQYSILENKNKKIIMTLELIEIGKPKVKSQFLQHMTELIHIKLEKTDTYNDLFRKIKKNLSDGSEARMIAAVEWVDYNLEGQEDKSIFDGIVSDEEGMYAIFNLKNK
jgi:hypothetical protein